METVISRNGQKNNLKFGVPLLSQHSDNSMLNRLTVQQALSKWYRFLIAGTHQNQSGETLFGDLTIARIIKSLQADLELIPELLMEELINNISITDKGQYIRLVQALLINLSDSLQDDETHEQLHNEVVTVLQFMENFLYQFFDYDFKVSTFHLKLLRDSISLKLEYWKIKLQGSPLIDVLHECITEKPDSPEDYLTFRKSIYIKNLFRQIESSTSVISESFIRELLIKYNFNTRGFINYEIEKIKDELSDENSSNDNLTYLRTEQLRTTQWKERNAVAYDIHQPSVKTQITQWIIEKIRNIEISDLKEKNKDLQIGPECKIQTTLSVAKLAVLFRLMVVDKIIINQPVAPALRTVAKVFTTLQKDEISFGSLETKYHAPDKTTLNSVKNILSKWINILGKL